MKNYLVSVDITMSKTVSVLACSEEDAIKIADKMISDNPYGYTNGFSHYVTHEVVGAEEEEY
jgi:hypothetical protein